MSFRTSLAPALVSLALLAGGFASAPAALGQEQGAPEAEAPSVRAPSPTKPNIVLIVTDDQRADTLDYMPLVKANLMDQGVTFTDMVAVNPLCCPSRASFLTGTYAHSHGVWSNKLPYGVDVFDKSSTIATWLQDRGYDTAIIGKYFNNYIDQPLGRGWDRSVVKMNFPKKVREEMVDDDCAYHMRVDGKERCFRRTPNNYYTYRLTRFAKSFMRGAERPFFMYWAPAAPHKPATPAPEDEFTFDGIPPYRPASHNEVDVTDKPMWLQNHHPLNDAEIRETDLFREHQLESLQAVDRAVEGFVTLLTEQGEMDETLFIFTSDNGMMWGEHRLTGKQYPYEESVLLPLVIRADWLIANPDTVDNRVVGNIDMAPTIAQLAGATPTIKVEGESIVSLLDGTASGWREGVGLEHLTHKDVVSYCGYRTEGYTYTAYGDRVQELYDLSADPLQITNLAANPAYDAIREDLRTKALDICKPHPPGRWNP